METTLTYATPDDIAAVRSELQTEKQARQAADAALAAMINGGGSPGGVFYVTPDGSDNNPGSQSQPFRTVGRGLQALGPGITLVGRGEFAESIERPPKAGSGEGARAKIVAAPGYTFTLKPPPGASRCIFHDFAGQSWFEYEGLTLAGHNVGYDAVKITYGSDVNQSAHHIRFKRMDVGYAIGQGFLITQTAAFCEVLDSKVHHCGNSDLAHGLYIQAPDFLGSGLELFENAGHGIQFYSGYGSTALRGRLLKSRVYGNSKVGKIRAGIIMASGADQLVEDCEVYGNRAGICIMGHATRPMVRRTTVRDNDNTGIQIDPGCQSPTLSYVTAHGNHPDINDSGTGTVYDHCDIGTKQTRDDDESRRRGGGNWDIDLDPRGEEERTR